MRRLYIIPESMKVKDALAAAKANNCPEIIQGIPPILQHEVSEADLPCVYEEQPIPELPSMDYEEEINSHKAEIADLKSRVKSLEEKVKK